MFKILRMATNQLLKVTVATLLVLWKRSMKNPSSTHGVLHEPKG